MPAEPRILVVDDSPTLRRLLTHVLRKRGARVSEASNGKAAVAAIESEPFDLIILDLKMPIMSGHEVLNRLRQMDGFATPVIILSADREEESKAAGLALGAVTYLTKPFQPEQLVALIDRVLAG